MSSNIPQPKPNTSTAADRTKVREMLLLAGFAEKSDTQAGFVLAGEDYKCNPEYNFTNVYYSIPYPPMYIDNPVARTMNHAYAEVLRTAFIVREVDHEPYCEVAYYCDVFRPDLTDEEKAYCGAQS